MRKLCSFRSLLCFILPIGGVFGRGPPIEVPYELESLTPISLKCDLLEHQFDCNKDQVTWLYEEKGTTDGPITIDPKKSFFHEIETSCSNTNDLSSTLKIIRTKETPIEGIYVCETKKRVRHAYRLAPVEKAKVTETSSICYDCLPTEENLFCRDLAKNQPITCASGRCLKFDFSLDRAVKNKEKHIIFRQCDIHDFPGLLSLFTQDFSELEDGQCVISTPELRNDILAEENLIHTALENTRQSAKRIFLEHALTADNIEFIELCRCDSDYCNTDNNKPPSQEIIDGYKSRKTDKKSASLVLPAQEKSVSENGNGSILTKPCIFPFLLALLLLIQRIY